MLFLIALVAVAAGGMAVRPEIPRWAPWLVPLAIGVVFHFLWRHEVDSTDGDPQPGLVKAEGIALVVLSVAAILVGWALRARSRDGNR